MAATAASDMQLNSVIVPGYIKANLPEVFSLAKSGLVQIDTSPPFGSTAAGGNTYTLRQWVRPTVGDSTPTANTDMAVKALTTTNEIGVIVRRGDIYGVEDLAAIAGGTTQADWETNVAAIITQEIAYNAESRFLTSMLPGLFGSSGVLYSTNTVDQTGQTFDWSMMQYVHKLVGEKVGSLRTVLMHPDVFYNTQLNTMLEMKPDYGDAAGYAAAGAAGYVGSIGPLNIFLNERLYNSGSAYYTLVGAPGAMYMGIQLPTDIWTWYDGQLAGGTQLVRYRTAYSPHVKGVSFTGTAPTVIGGATDAALALYSNWTAKTGYTIKENPLAVIISA